MTCRLTWSLSCLLMFAAYPATAHQADTSNSVLTLTPNHLQMDLTFSLADLVTVCGLNPGGDRIIMMERLKGSLGPLYDCVAPYFGVSLDHRSVRLERAQTAFSDEDLLRMLPTGLLDLKSPAHPSATLSYQARLPRLPENLVLSVRFHELFSEKHAHLSSVTTADGVQTAAFSENQTRLRFATGGKVPFWSQILTFTLLGFEHISIGYDHILFLLALILLKGRFLSLLKIITAFTVAHSVTLALAVLGLVTLPPRLVDCGIALSITYVAAENFFVRKADHRWILTFFFGLVHGFGFASVLAGLGLPSRGLASSLLAFNIGIELGQIVILALFYPVVLWASEKPFYRRAMFAASGVILLFGLGWLVERAAGLEFMPF